MRDIARLVFGGESDDERDLRDEGGACYPGGLESPFTRGMPLPREAGEWCKTPPGDATLSWLAASLHGRNARRTRGRGRSLAVSPVSSSGV